MKLLIFSLISILLSFPMTSVYAEKSTICLPNYEKEEVHNLKADLDKDGVKENISTMLAKPAWKTDGTYICVVTVEENGQKVSLAVPIETAMESYNISVIDVGPDYINSFIGIDYHVGMHSHILVLLRYFDYRNQGCDSKPIFEKTAQFFSDYPLYEIKDVNGDGINEIISKDRDYHANLLKDNFISVYKYKDRHIADSIGKEPGTWERISVYRTVTEEYMPKRLG